ALSLGFPSRIDSVRSIETTVGLTNPRGQMKVTTKTSTDESTIGPPAESEYAVEPVGVDTMTPSPLNLTSSSESTPRRKSNILAGLPDDTTSSFRASITCRPSKRTANFARLSSQH